MKLPSSLPAEQVVVTIDNREQDPWSMTPMRSEPGTLQTGDYQIKHISAVVERKSLEDLIGCIGRGRDRFERELERLQAFDHRLVIVEAPWGALAMKTWRGQVTSTQAIGSVLGWTGQVGFLFAGTRQSAQDACRRFLYIAARREWRKLRALAGGAFEMETGEV